MSEKKKYSVIDLDEKHSPAVLSGILDIPVPTIYQYRSTGQLPSNADCTYREAILHFIRYHKQKSNLKSSSVAEAKMIQDIRNGIAKEELQWIEVKKEKELLVNVGEFLELITPIFQLLRMNLVEITRKHPQTIKQIDNMLQSLNVLGGNIAHKAKIDSAEFVRAKMETEIKVTEEEQEKVNQKVKRKFGLPFEGEVEEIYD